MNLVEDFPMSNSARPSIATRTALVAGGAGFLGSHLCDRLVDDGFRVICLDNFKTGSLDNLRSLARESRFSLIEADVTEPLPAGLRADRIYNLACPASPPHYQDDPVHTLLTSVLGMRNLLELARVTGARILQSSTSEVYGDPDQHPQTEAYWGNVNPIGVRACYDEGKRAAETLCFDYLRRHGLSVRVARIFNTYGPRMQPDDGRIVSNLLIQALAGQPLTIYGTGEQTRSFCYVSDLVEGLVRLMEAEPEPGVPVNLGNPEEYTIKQLAWLVLELTGSASPMLHQPLPADDPHCRRPDITRARTLLGWQPQVPVRLGLRTTMTWFKAGPERRADPRRAGNTSIFVPAKAAAATEAY
jgi:UDP-glucuronate decarboxylase